MSAGVIRVEQLASVRSGDKGNHANLGVVAANAAAYQFLVRELTPERVRAFFENLELTAVRRYELPKVQALNFVLENALAGGASLSLKIDTQGKLLGTALLDLELPASADFLATFSGGAA